MTAKKTIDVKRRQEMQSRLKTLKSEVREIMRELGDPRVVTRICRGCGGTFSARAMRSHACKVPVSRR